jgi:hypothetical protein
MSNCGGSLSDKPLQQQPHLTTTAHLKTTVLTGPLWRAGVAQKDNPTMSTCKRNTNHPQRKSEAGAAFHLFLLL